MPDMQGKTVVVTGGNSGIGFETAAALAAMGARVLVTARNADKGRAAVSALAQRSGPEGQVQLVVFDLADLSSVRRGAAEILADRPTTGRPRQQRWRGAQRTRRDGGRAGGHFRHEPPRPLPADQPPSGSDRGVRAFTHRERRLDRAHRGAPGDPVRRPPVGAALCRHAGLRAVEAGQHPLHAGAGPAPRGHWRHGELAAPLDRAHRVRRGRRHSGPARLRHPHRQPVLPVAGQGRPHLHLPGVVPGRGRCQREVLREVPAEGAEAMGPGPGRGAPSVAGQRRDGRSLAPDGS